MATKKTKNASAAKEPATDWSQYSNTGFENVSQSDLGIPFLAIIQKGSPEVDEDHEDHATKKITGAKVGAIFNTVSRELVYIPEKSPLEFVPVSYDKFYVEWKSRESGGGIVESHKDSSILRECVRNDKGQDQLPNGNVIVTTAYFSGYYIHPESGDHIKAVIGFSSTQLKKSRMWLNMLMARKIPGSGGRPYPMFAQTFYLSTTTEKNEKGSWRGWLLEAGAIINDPALLEYGSQECANFRQEAMRTLPSATTSVDTDDDTVPY